MAIATGLLNAQTIGMVVAEPDSIAEIIITKSDTGYNVLNPKDSNILHSELDTIYRERFNAQWVTQYKGKWGLIHFRTGEAIIPLIHDTPPELIASDTWKVELNSKRGLYAYPPHKFGKLECTIPPTMDNIQQAMPSQVLSLIIVSNNNLCGLYWNSGKEILPIAYKSILPQSSFYIYAWKEMNGIKSRHIFNSLTGKELKIDEISRFICAKPNNGWLEPNECFFLAQLGKLQGVLDSRARWVIPLGNHTISKNDKGEIEVRKSRKRHIYTIAQLEEISISAQRQEATTTVSL